LHYFSAFYFIIQVALERLLRLQELKLMVPDPNFVKVLDNAYIQSLRHFECYLPLTCALARFLNRHPTIIYLQIAPNEALIPSSSSSTDLAVLPRVVLPKLQYFVGNSECVSALVPHASLRAAFIFWETMDSKPHDTIRCLELSSGDTINLVSCRRQGWNLDLINLISLWLPNIYVLIIMNLVVDSRPSPSYLNSITSLLPRFSMLRRLHLHCTEWNTSDDHYNLDEDFETVVAWSAACPSLTECILPHSNGLKWFRRHDIWIPDPDSSESIKWTWNMLHSTKHTQWNHLSTILTNLTPNQTLNEDDFTIGLQHLLQLEPVE